MRPPDHYSASPPHSFRTLRATLPCRFRPSAVRKKRALPDGLVNASYPTLCCHSGSLRYGRRAPRPDLPGRSAARDIRPNDSAAGVGRVETWRDGVRSVLRALSLRTCCRHYPGAAAGRSPRSSPSAVTAFLDNVVGSACTSSFSRPT
jgi:hypothetical protein